ncbi:MAG: hypothetical protein K0U93_28530, partial [Gammaproteobacteria bacterium]|nr:hypothetical protein [Gammaproteobacteria bacterium]
MKRSAHPNRRSRAAVESVHARRAMKFSCAALLALLAWTTAEAQEAAHPLDALTANEFIRARLALESNGDLNASVRIPDIALSEPDKDFVRRWRAGDPFPRRAKAMLRRAGRTFEVEIDLDKKVVLRSSEAPGESLVLSESYTQANAIIMSDADARDAFSAREISAKDVFCVPLTSSSSAAGPNRHRVMRVSCYLRPTSSNHFAQPIDGLVFVIDFDA